MSEQRVPIRIRAIVLGALAAVLLAAVALPASAGAFVYWTHSNLPDLIGRANLDGSAPNQSFISGESTFAPGIAVDGSHIYWTDGGKIGRSNLDGSGVNPDFVPGATTVGGITVDGAHIYWSSGTCVGRANLDGSEAEKCFISTGEGTRGVAVGGGFIFWSNVALGGEIGRANLEGKEIKEPFIPSTASGGIAASDTEIYWNNGANGIGTSDFAGKVVAPSWIPGAFGSGVAVDGTYIYWASNGIGRVGRDGSGFNANFIPSATATYGVAVDAGAATVQPPATGGGNPPPPSTPPGPPPPPSSFSFGALKLNKKSGGATLTLVLPGPGEVVLKGRGLVSITKIAKGKGKFNLAIKPTKKTRQTLQKSGKVKVTAKVTFTPTGGTPLTESKALTLKG